MSLGTLLLAIYLIAVGIIGLETAGLKPRVIAVLALLAGIFLIIEGFHPITIIKT